MAYAWTPGKPDMPRALQTGNPQHVTRKPRRKLPEHVHIDPEQLHGAEKLFQETSEDHNSVNTYYKMDHSTKADCIVIRADDSCIKWMYPDGARQCARAYACGIQPPMTPFVKKCANCDGSLRTIHTVPPELVPSVPNAPVPPGDVVALWQRRVQKGDKDGANEICSLLRQGRLICVYPFL